MLKRLFLILSIFISVVVADFEPYQLNGGLIAAVAGKDWIVLSSDTRMVESYNILQRDHISSRIWSATDSALTSSSSSEDVSFPPLFRPDGSINVLLEEATGTANTFFHGDPPVMIGSSGCNADCEQLKRLVRADLRMAHFFSESQSTVSQVATLLGQVLYSRRGFPFYSFCIVAGLESGDDGKETTSAVYVYDAIGSYEKVAVATAGTGRELLQPILDRKFRPLVKTVDAGDELQKRHVTTVRGTPEQAIRCLLEGYRSVAEREVAVGDHVVFCLLQRCSNGGYSCSVSTSQLKKH